MPLTIDPIDTVVFENSPDAIMVSDGERIIQTVNPAFTTLFGYNQDDVRGRSTLILYADPDDFERMDQRRRQEDPSKPPGLYQVAYKRKDGGVFHSETTGRPIFGKNGDHRGHVVIIRDISARIKLNELFHSVVTLSGRVDSDTDDTVRSFIKQGCGYFGLAAGMVSHVAGDRLTVRYLVGSPEGLAESDIRDASRTFCGTVLEFGGARSYHHAGAGEASQHPCYAEQGMESYIGCPLHVAGNPYGTLSFFGYTPRPAPFSGEDETLIVSLAEWLDGFLTQAKQRAELRQMGEKLATNAENFKHLYHQTPAMLHSTDSDGRMIEASDAWLKELGYSREEVIGRPIMDFFTPASGERTKRVLADFWSGRYRLKDEPRQLVRKDGTILDAELSAVIARSVGETRARSLAVIVDVTERNRGRRKLERNAETFRRLYRETPAMLHSVTPEGRIVEVSDHWLQKMGFDSRDEVLGRSMLDFHTPEQRAIVAQCIADFWRTGEPVWNRCYDFLRKDGTTFEAELSVIVGKPKGESEAHSLAISFDVTERNKARRQLELKNAELKRLNEELDTFASVASHDLREPLRKIREFSEVLEEELPDGLSGDGAYALCAMRSAVQRMQTLIADLLDYARTANMSIDAEPVDLTSLVDSVSEDLSVAISEAQAEIAAAPLPTVHGDALQLRQLFQNLIVNAIKYRDSSRPCLVRLAAERGRDCAWRISVHDNGIGFDPDAGEKIFMPFKRLQPRSAASGSGLGLTICGRIAERHGWSLRAHSVPGEGSTFTLEIPASGA